MTSFKITSADLRKATGHLRHAYQRRNTIPIISHTLMVLDRRCLTLSQTELDMLIEVDVEVFDTTPTPDLKITVPFPFLASLPRAIDGAITFTHHPAEARKAQPGLPERLTFEGDGITGTINLVCPADDFPANYFDEARATGDRHTASAKALHRLFSLGRHAVSNEGTRYYLNGSHLCRKPNGTTLRAVSTDGHRLAVIDSDIAWDEATCILPKAAQDALRAIADPNSNDEFRFALTKAANKAVFERPGLRFFTKLIDGTFPDYTRVIPKETDGWRATLSLAGVSRLFGLIPGDGGSHAVKIDCAAKTASMTSSTGMQVSMPISAEGAMQIGFNGGYLVQQGRRTPTMTLQGKGQGDPCIIRGEDADAFFVLMPMRV